MATNNESAGVSTREIDLSGPLSIQPIGIPAGVVGTAERGTAFVPVTVGTAQDFAVKFGAAKGKHFGMYAVREWLRFAQAVTFMRVLGAGDCKQRTSSGNNAGKVTNSGFVVGNQLPNTTAGAFGTNPYANNGGELGRLYFLGCLMSQSAGSTIFTDANIQKLSEDEARPIIRGIIMAPSGVILTLSSSRVSSSGVPSSTALGRMSQVVGGMTGTVVLLKNGVSVQEATLYMNGHIGSSEFPRAITLSFDPDAPNYLANVLNTDPLQYEAAGHFLYAHYPIHTSLAALTGAGIIRNELGSGGTGGNQGQEEVAFITTGSMSRTSGSLFTPNYENFEDRFTVARTPWFVSQKFGGNRFQLFRIHSLDAGVWPNDKIKISIENITPSTDPANLWGSFDVIVRSFSDTDTERKVLEAFRQVTLNQSSEKYIGRVIGDQNIYFDFDQNTQSQKLVLDGDFETKSNYIRVEISDAVKTDTVPETALPIGFRGHDHLITSGTEPLATVAADGGQPTTLFISHSADILKMSVQPPIPLRTSVALGTGQSAKSVNDFYWGVHFEMTDDPADPNKSTKKHAYIAEAAKYLPNFNIDWLNVSTGSNAGIAADSRYGVIDCDLFNNNGFALDKIRVVTTSADVADTTEAVNWSYKRDNIIAVDSTHRAFDPAKDLTTAELRGWFKYTTFLQGGFDGVNLFETNMANLTDVAVRQEIDSANRGQLTGPTVSAFRKATDVMKNTSDVDIKLFSTPGIRHTSVTDYAIQATKERFDALYVMDVEDYDSANVPVTSSQQTHSSKNTAAIFRARALDSSFAAAYYPNMIITDPDFGNVEVPPSVTVLGAYSLNDKIGFPWFAPAGKTRGKMEGAIDTVVPLKKANLDELYSVDINPLTSFPDSEGLIVWGQKTLLAAASSLDRVSVRRLLIEIRRMVREVANTFIFEPNRASTLARFQSAVNPRLALVKKQAGLVRFKVMIDTTTTTQADVENNTIRGKIFVQPTRTAEFVALDFVVTNAGSTI